ncbi:hypothetical protein, partial [Priestia megaterium]
WIPVIIFLFFLIIGFSYTVKYSLKKVDDKYKYLPLMMVINFFMLSVAEVMTFTLSMLLLFFSLGSTLTKKELLEEKTTEVIPQTKKRRKLVW